MTESDGDSETDTQGPPTPTSSTAQADSEDDIPESDVHFAFGPQNWYFVRCGDTWRFVRSKQSVWENEDFKDAHWVAFKHTTGTFIGGETRKGTGRVIHTWNDGYLVKASEVDSFIESRQAYSKLHDWLCETTKSDAAKVKKVAITIGPNGSYFARCRSSWISHDLPLDLAKAIEEDESKPAVVALGVDDSWIVIWSDGTRSWNLRYKYPALQETGILGTKIDTMKPFFAALSPYEKDEYLVVSRNGQFNYKTALGSSEESEKLHQLTDAYMVAQAKLHGHTFNQTFTRDGWTRKSVISPDGVAAQIGPFRSLYWWKERRDVMMQRDALLTAGTIGAGAGMLSKLAGGSTMKAVGTAGLTGIVAGMFYSQGYLQALQTYRNSKL
ncbi:hypothetical protein K491DRAFT_686996 [Lophiostoma macrostomum CBS 122681]|uniref:Uncharacterized protein n=1 Tax=Lophiostoma macrostomum CBS 122681 TaxID=1314788 RepID=A0A6A6TQD6_9PLEO|nr:hypothetical protein K491DRAFT_686996 [Lophiostoma macrostomum CBS 122681]